MARQRHIVDGHRVAVRSSRQTTRVQWLAQRPRPLDTQVRKRLALWAGGCRRWLCRLCVHHRTRSLACPRPAPPALRGRDRELRRERFTRLARLHRRAQAAPWQGQPCRVSGQWCRQLRPAVVDHQLARHGQWRLEGRGADRRRAFGRRQRPGAQYLSCHAPGAGQAGRQPHRPLVAREFSLRRACLAFAASPGHGGTAG